MKFNLENIKKTVKDAVIGVGMLGTTTGAMAKEAVHMDKADIGIEAEFKQMQNAGLDLDTARTQFQNEQDRLLGLYSYDQVATEKIKSISDLPTKISLNVRSFVQKKLSEGMNIEDIKKAAVEHIKSNPNTKDDYKIYVEIAEDLMKGGLPSKEPNIGLPSEHDSHQRGWMKALNELVAAEVVVASETNDYQYALTQNNESQKSGGAVASAEE